MSRASPLAGFQVIIIGRFWVITEASRGRKARIIRTSQCFWGPTRCRCVYYGHLTARPGGGPVDTSKREQTCASLWLHYDVTMSRKGTNGAAKRRALSVRVPLTVRLPEDLINRIDEDLEHRDIPLSRNTWLLEAAIEKLRKVGPGGSHGAK